MKRIPAANVEEIKITSFVAKRDAGVEAEIDELLLQIPYGSGAMVKAAMLQGFLDHILAPAQEEAIMSDETKRQIQVNIQTWKSACAKQHEQEVREKLILP